jgi:hypothetical protein
MMSQEAQKMNPKMNFLDINSANLKKKGFKMDYIIKLTTKIKLSLK